MEACARYFVIGGSPFSMYTGTTTFTDLRLLGSFDNICDAETCVNENYEECAGLIQIFEAAVENLQDNVILTITNTGIPVDTRKSLR